MSHSCHTSTPTTHRVTSSTLGVSLGTSLFHRNVSYSREGQKKGFIPYFASMTTTNLRHLSGVGDRDEFDLLGPNKGLSPRIDGTKPKDWGGPTRYLGGVRPVSSFVPAPTEFRGFRVGRGQGESYSTSGSPTYRDSSVSLLSVRVSGENGRSARRTGSGP